MKIKIVVLALMVAALFLTSCESTERKIKDIQSSWVGLNRKVVVYSYGGQVIGEWSGKIDISSSSIDGTARILFETPNGKRVAIYNATVIAVEK